MQRGIQADVAGSSYVLGIESSCDETAAAVVADGQVVCASVVASQVELHATYGGVFPELASRQHVRDIVPTVQLAMSQAGKDWSDLAAVAVTYGPGLTGSLLVGVNVAKGLTLSRGLPLVGVSHLEGHLYSNWLHAGGEVITPAVADTLGEALAEPRVPHLALIVSGGHTDLVFVTGHRQYRRVGSTMDDAAGEAFDKAARMLGLGYPGGPAIEGAAVGADRTRFALPVAETRSPLDFSFSGVKTALMRKIESLEAAGEQVPVADLAASFQNAIVRALTGRVLLALESFAAEEVLLAGGVSANLALREDLVSRCPVGVRYPPSELCTDNAAMIAAAGYWALADGERAGMDLDVVPGLGL
jgi:N6-L-threonylcarbamoyladenine synthase